MKFHFGILLLFSAVAIAQPPPPANANAPDAREAAAHRAKARELAGSDFQITQRLQCAESGPGGSPQLGGPRVNAPFVKVFDSLYYIGLTEVGAWAVKTSQGVILLDAIFTNTVETTLLPGFKELNLDPAQVKYLVITHGHGDHFGGAKYFQDKFDTRVIMSGEDWNLLERPAQGKGPKGLPDEKPRRDITAIDGEKVTLGDTTLTLILTPGHTPATLSILIPVTDNGKPHLAALWGGTGIPGPIDAKRQYITSAAKLARLGSAAGVDVALSNHPFVDGTIERAARLKNRKPSDPHPFVIGTPGFVRYMGVIEECAQVNLARVK